MDRGLWNHIGQRPRLTAWVVFAFATCVYVLTMRRDNLTEHTPFNHYALLAQGWLEGRLDLGGAPPPYAGGNDFARYAGRWFVAFPPAPALLLLPWVALAGGAERCPDGLIFAVLAGIAPAGLYLALDRLRREHHIHCDVRLPMALVALYAFGTVYFFSAVQGTVWFAAHVVAAAGTTLFLYCAIGARYPIGAAWALSLAVGARPTLLGLAVFFGLEWRWGGRVASDLNEPRRDWRSLAAFCGPISFTLAILAWYNWARFGNVFEFGYRYLAIAWQARIEKWGLFGYHYLARNLGVLLTSLPYVEHGRSGWSVQINGHGLALWLTTPVYLWLLYPRVVPRLGRELYLTLGLVAIPSLFYQNTGWIQFGQRFSNDYAPLLMLLLALGGYAWTAWTKSLWAASVAVNLFGAVSFDRAEWSRFYFVERSQRVIYQPD